jgi:hypothetical protein
VSNCDLKWPSTTVANPSVGGLSARTVFFGSGSSMDSRGFFMVIPFAFIAMILLELAQRLA